MNHSSNDHICPIHLFGKPTFFLFTEFEVADLRLQRFEDGLDLCTFIF